MDERKASIKDVTVQATLESGMRFIIETGSGYQMAVDAAHDVGGQNSAPSPIEMLLSGLAGCVGISILSILYKRKQQIQAYEVHVHSKRTEDHPKVFTQISIEHIFTGQNMNPQAVQRAIDLSEERYCGVSIMLGKTATITHTFRIIEA